MWRMGVNDVDSLEEEEEKKETYICIWIDCITIGIFITKRKRKKTTTYRQVNLQNNAYSSITTQYFHHQKILLEIFQINK